MHDVIYPLDATEETPQGPRYRLAISDGLGKAFASASTTEEREAVGRVAEAPLGSYRPVPQARRFHQSSARFRWALGGNRCLGPDTLIESPDRPPRRVSDIKGPHRVWAWNGRDRVPSAASEPWVKGWEPCYRVWLSGQRWFDCSAEHRVLSDRGYVSVGSLLRFAPYLPETTAGIFPPEFRPSAPRSIRIREGFRGGFGSPFCGVQPARGGEIGVHPPGRAPSVSGRNGDEGRSFPPQQSSGEQPRTVAVEVVHGGGQDNTGRRSEDPFRSGSFHPSNLDGRAQREVRSAGFLFCVSDTISRRFDCDRIIARKPTDASAFLSRPSDVFVQQAIPVLAGGQLEVCGCRACRKGLRPSCPRSIVGGPPQPCPSLRLRSNAEGLQSGTGERCRASFSSGFLSGEIPEIIGYTYLGIRPIYDFEVPEWHNYATAGVVHHNSSKSESLAHEVAWYLTGTHPWKAIKTPCEVWYCTITWELVGSILWKKLKRLLDGFPYEVSWHNKIDQIPRAVWVEVDGGRSLCSFKAYEQGADVFQGTEKRLIAFDEQFPQDIYTESVTRIGGGQPLDFAAAMTPIKSQPWLEEKLRNPAENSEIFEFPLDDNRESRGGFIADKEIDATIAEWPPEVRPTRRAGKWGSFIGSIFQTFSREVHVVTPDRESHLFLKGNCDRLPYGWHAVGAIDWGGSNPFCFLWAVRVPHLDHDWYVLDEYYWSTRRQGQRRLEQHAKEIKDRTESWGTMLERVHADHDPTDAYEMAGYGVPSQPARKDDVKATIETVQTYLNPREHLSNQYWPNGRPRLHIAERCANLIREIGTYRWAEVTSGNKDPRDEPAKKDDHAVDALRYLIHSERLADDAGESPESGMVGAFTYESESFQ